MPVIRLQKLAMPATGRRTCKRPSFFNTYTKEYIAWQLSKENHFSPSPSKLKIQKQKCLLIKPFPVYNQQTLFMQQKACLELIAVCLKAAGSAILLTDLTHGGYADALLVVAFLGKDFVIIPVKNPIKGIIDRE